MRLVDHAASNHSGYNITDTIFLLHYLKCLFELQVFLYGGYFKEIQSDKGTSERGVVHADMWSLDPRTWQWNKVYTQS